MSQENAEEVGKNVTKLQAAFRGMIARRRMPEKPKTVYVPTSLEAIDSFLKLAQVHSKDVVLDIGCGDGRVLREAWKQSHARGIGIELDQKLVDQGKSDIVEDDMANAVSLHCMSFNDPEAVALIHAASVVFLFMLPELTAEIAQLLLKHAQPTARVVSFIFSLPNWTPDAIQPHQEGISNLYLYSLRKQKMNAADGDVGSDAR